MRSLLLLGLSPFRWEDPRWQRRRRALVAQYPEFGGYSASHFEPLLQLVDAAARGNLIFLVLLALALDRGEQLLQSVACGPTWSCNTSDC